MKNSLFVLLLVAVVSISCKKDDKEKSPGINIFSVNDDIELGRQLDEQILASPSEYPILSEQDYPEAYAHIRRIRDNVLNSGEVQYRDRFDWQIRIINQDVLNAFCAPGGYIYFYTGIIKYLDSEYELAGVMGHEIAHADRRHSSRQLTAQYGAGIMLDVVLGKDRGTLTDIAANLAFLKYGRSFEEEADKYSVIYLCKTDYRADGAAGFFEKIDAEGGTRTPQFLSSHPDPGNRIQSIRNESNERNCSGSLTTGTYQDFKNSLP